MTFWVDFLDFTRQVGTALFCSIEQASYVIHLKNNIKEISVWGAEPKMKIESLNFLCFCWNMYEKNKP